MGPHRGFIRWTLLGVLGAALAAAVAFGATRGTRVSVVRADRRELVQTVVATGRVMPPAKVQLGSLTMGVVSDVRAEEGQRVRKGDLLVQLNDAEARAAVEQATAGVSAARLRLQQIRRLAAPAAAEDLRQASVAREQAQAAFDRLAELFKGQAISKSQLDDARSALDLARSREQRAALQVSSTSPAGTDWALALASVAQAEAALAVANSRLSDTRIVAPADGMVIARGVEPGDVVAGGKILMVLAREGEVRIEVPFDEKNLAWLREGQEATASAEAFADDRFRARILQVAPSVDPARGTVNVRFVVREPPPYLRPDMTVSVEVEVSRRSQALVLPAAAVRDAGTARPFVLVASSGRAERREVSLGTRGEGMVEVLTGLEPGDLVVAEAPEKVRPGQRVRFDEARAAAPPSRAAAQPGS